MSQDRRDDFVLKFVFLVSVRVRVIWVRVRSQVVSFTTGVNGFFLQWSILWVFWGFWGFWGSFFWCSIFVFLGALGSIYLVTMSFLGNFNINFFSRSVVCSTGLPPLVFESSREGGWLISGT